MTNIPTIAVIGDTDCGKSTLIGKLLTETGSLPSHFIRRVKKLCRDRNIDFQPAYLVDYMREEQAANSTLERTLAVLHLHGATYTIIDTPGQIMLASKMVSGLCEADIVLIVLDIQEQNLKKYLFYFTLVSLLRVPHTIIVINKIDLIDYRRSYYKRFVERLHREIKGSAGMTIVPASALQGVNLVNAPRGASSFGNRSLGDALASLVLGNKKSRTPSSFFMPVQGVVNREKERVALGTVSEGSISIGDCVTCAAVHPFTLKVEKIFHDGRAVTTVSSGGNAGLTFEACSRKVKRGDLLHNADKPIETLRTIDAWLFTVTSFLSDMRGLSVLLLTDVYPVQQMEITRRLDVQLHRVDTAKTRISPHEFIRATLVFHDPVFPSLERYRRSQRIAVRNAAGILAIGIMTRPRRRTPA